MNVLRAACCVLTSGLLLAGCKADDPATPWEIVHGTATLAASKAVDTATYSQIFAYTGRSGSITVADDSIITGWIKFSPADSQHHFTGTLSLSAGDPLMTFSGIDPWKYRLLTSSAFPDTYGLVSDTVLTADLVGDATPEHYRVYWEFHK